jgi:hypothetical protein
MSCGNTSRFWDVNGQVRSFNIYLPKEPETDLGEIDLDLDYLSDEDEEDLLDEQEFQKNSDVESCEGEILHIHGKPHVWVSYYDSLIAKCMSNTLNCNNAAEGVFLVSDDDILATKISDYFNVNVAVISPWNLSNKHYSGIWAYKDCMKRKILYDALDPWEKRKLGTQMPKYAYFDTESAIQKRYVLVAEEKT